MHATQTVEIDALTKLPNRTGWQQCVQAGLDRVQNDTSVCSQAILFIDLDRFKWVNDTLGHDAGDQLLQKVAVILTSLVDQNHQTPDVVGRFGGDEFVVYIQSPHSYEKMEVIATEMVRALSQPIELKTGSKDATEVEIGASIGIACYPFDANNMDGLIKCADLAMYRAKHSGRNQVVAYKPEMLRQIQYRRRIQSKLRSALRDEKLALDYLPIYDSKKGHVVAFESILHVQGVSVLEDLDIAELLTIADESQVAVSLGQWMLQETLRMGQLLNEQGYSPSFVIEVRAALFQQKEFVSWLAEEIEKVDFPAEQLVISLNESCIKTQRFSVLDQLNELSNLGVEIALKGFGSASWPIIRLNEWPIDRLHLSSRFVQEIGQSASMEMMAGALIEMGRALNKKVVAFGVLNAEQFSLLSGQQCYAMQGPFFSDVLNPEEVELVLVEQSQGRKVTQAAFDDPFYEEQLMEEKLDRGEIKRNHTLS